MTAPYHWTPELRTVPVTANRWTPDYESVTLDEAEAECRRLEAKLNELREKREELEREEERVEAAFQDAYNRGATELRDIHREEEDVLEAGRALAAAEAKLRARRQTGAYPAKQVMP